MSERLKPCPFCRSDDAPHVMDEADIDGDPEIERGRYFVVVCDAKKYGCGSAGAPKRTAEEAIAAWNRRAAPPGAEQEELRAVIAELKSTAALWGDNEHRRLTQRAVSLLREMSQ